MAWVGCKIFPNHITHLCADCVCVVSELLFDIVVLRVLFCVQLHFAVCASVCPCCIYILHQIVSSTLVRKFSKRTKHARDSKDKDLTHTLTHRL